MQSSILLAIEDVAACFAIAAVLVVAVALGVGVILLVARAARLRGERMAAIEKLANEIGLGGPGVGWFPSFDNTPQPQLFGDFQEGHSRGATWVRASSIDIHGIRADLVLADYLYKVTSRDGKRSVTVTHEFSCLLWTPTMELPEQLSLRREGALDWLGEWVGINDIDFESSEFSNRFNIKCSDKRAAYDLFDPRMMEWMLQAEPPNLVLISGTFLFRGAGLYSAEEFAGVIRWIGLFIHHFPRHFVDSRVPKEDVSAWEARLQK